MSLSQPSRNYNLHVLMYGQILYGLLMSNILAINGCSFKLDLRRSKFSFFDGDVLRSTSYGVYISQFIRFARVSSHVTDFIARNKILTGKLLYQGYRIHKL